jgi:CBS-domain-containing membrane protein
MVASASTVFEDDYEATCGLQHVHAASKRQTPILDAKYKAADLKEIIRCISTIVDNERNKLLKLLRKYEHQFDGTFCPMHLVTVK